MNTASTYHTPILSNPNNICIFYRRQSLGSFVYGTSNKLCNIICFKIGVVQQIMLVCPLVVYWLRWTLNLKPPDDRQNLQNFYQQTDKKLYQNIAITGYSLNKRQALLSSKLLFLSQNCLSWTLANPPCKSTKITMVNISKCPTRNSTP